MSEWKRVDKSVVFPAQKTPFLILDDLGTLWPGFTPFDYYEAEWWCEYPEFPADATERLIPAPNIESPQEESQAPAQNLSRDVVPGVECEDRDAEQ